MDLDAASLWERSLFVVSVTTSASCNKIVRFTLSLSINILKPGVKYTVSSSIVRNNLRVGLFFGKRGRGRVT